MLNQLSSIIFPTDQKITEEVIRHFEENPDELDLMINKEYFNAVYLGLIFVLGLGITIGARVLQYLYGEWFGAFVNAVVLDVLSEVGIAIFGGAVVAYLIEFLNKRQFQQNIQFRREVKKIIEERKQMQGA